MKDKFSVSPLASLLVGSERLTVVFLMKLLSMMEIELTEVISNAGPLPPLFPMNLLPYTDTSLPPVMYTAHAALSMNVLSVMTTKLFLLR